MRAGYAALLLLFSFIAFPFLVAFLASGCGTGMVGDNPVPAVAVPMNEQGGGSIGFAIHLPVPAGKVLQCVQGAGGDFSHRGTSTRHDIDLDTSNVGDEEVYAPVAGTVRVHKEDAAANFGYHVNIDLGDNSYIVIAHLKSVFVSDGEEVTPGQLVGYEGCTGRCTGDHIHIGRHQGDAAQKAEFGTSVPLSYLVSDAGRSTTVAGDAFICGIPAGHRYASALPVALWHPDGTLVKLPDDPKVYLIENGAVRWIASEDVFWARGYRFDDVAFMSKEEFACYGYGHAIDEPDVAANTNGFPEGVLLKEASRPDVYVVSHGVAMPVKNQETFLLLGFGRRRVNVVPDGTVASSLRVGSCAAGIWCIDLEAVTLCGGPELGTPDILDEQTFEEGPGIGQDPETEPEPESDEGTSPPDSLPEENEPAPEETEPAPEENASPAPEEEAGDTVDSSNLLTVSWETPFGQPAERITLSGEYVFMSGTWGFSWRDLVTVHDASMVSYAIDGAGGGDSLRFSVEYVGYDGHVSWSCIGPYPPGIPEGTARASYDGMDVRIRTVDDPTSDGCGLFVGVP